MAPLERDSGTVTARYAMHISWLPAKPCVIFVALALQYREFCTPLDGVFIAVARALGSTCETWQDFLDAHGPDFGVVRNSAALLVAFAVSSIELNFRDDNWNNDEWIRAQPASKSAELLFRLEHFLVFE